MIPNEIALPMYDLVPHATDALAAALLRYFPHAHFTRPADLLAHWQHDGVLLSQACGYPLATKLHDVQVVGCFHYTAPGCEGPNYRSLLVTRAENRSRTLADFRGLTAACNARDSQSGYRALLTETGGDAVFFSHIVWSGSHRQSLAALQREEADIAAIDCVTFALLARYQPQALAGLTVIGKTTSTAGLPLITSRKTSARGLNALRTALGEIAREEAIAGPLLIEGFSAIERDSYAGFAQELF